MPGKALLFFYGGELLLRVNRSFYLFIYLFILLLRQRQDNYITNCITIHDIYYVTKLTSIFYKVFVFVNFIRYETNKQNI